MPSRKKSYCCVVNVLSPLPSLALCHCALSLPIQYGDFDPNLYQPGFLANERILPQRVSYHVVTCVYCIKTASVCMLP